MLCTYRLTRLLSTRALYEPAGTGAHIHLPFGACGVCTLPTKKPFWCAMHVSLAEYHDPVHTSHYLSHTS